LQDSTLQTAIEHFDCALTAVSLYELNAVPFLVEKQRAALLQLQTVLESLAFDALAAERAAQVWRSLASRGLLIGLPDILLAGVCLANDLPLLTRNSEHFRRVEGLHVITPDELLASFRAT
jgi:tRNA(fMet)-specific endonuclease VapC